MSLPSLTDLALFTMAVLALTVFGLAASGHFPREHRAPALRTAAGAGVLWGSIALALIAAVAVLVGAIARLPWYAAIIGGGLMVLLAPLVLQQMPDRLADGAAVLVFCALSAAVLALLLHA